MDQAGIYEKIWARINLPENYCGHIPITVSHTNYCETCPERSGFTVCGTVQEILDQIIEHRRNRPTCDKCDETALAGFGRQAASAYSNNGTKWLHVLNGRLQGAENSDAQENSLKISIIRSSQKELDSLCALDNEIGALAQTTRDAANECLQALLARRDNKRAEWLETSENKNHWGDIPQDETPILVSLQTATDNLPVGAYETVNLYEIAYRDPYSLLRVPYWRWETLAKQLKDVQYQTSHMLGLDDEYINMAFILWDPKSSGPLRSLYGAIEAARAVKQTDRPT